MSEKKGLKLIGMKVSNFLRVENFNYEFDGKSVKLSGKNGAGKTTLLQAIWAACHGKSAVPADPRHNGAKKGEIVLDFGDLTVKRNFTEKDSYLTVTRADKSRPANPQQLLDELVGTVALDPHSFLELAPKAQMETAAVIAGVSAELIKIDAGLKTVMEDRTFAGRQVRDLQGVFSRMPIPTDDAKLIDVAELSSKVDASREATGRLSEFDRLLSESDRNIDYHEQNIDSQIKRIDTLKEEAKIETERIKSRLDNALEDIDERVADARMEVDKYRNQKNLVTTEKEELVSRFDGMPKIEEIEQQLSEATDHNDKVRSDQVGRNLWETKKKELADAEEKHKALDERVDKGRAMRAGVIQKANLPVPGIDFSSDGLLFNGHPFENASHAEQLRVAVGILMSQNPELRLLTIKDASLMDCDSWSVVEELSKKHDFQVLYECVSDEAAEGDSGLFISDGALTHVDGEKV